MRKFIQVAAVLVLVLSVGSVAANAQTQITLGPTASGSIAFVGSGGNVTINLGACSGGTCTLHGLSALLPPGPDGYTIIQSGAISLSSAGTISQASPISFSYSNGIGGTLTGSLQLVNFIQAGTLGLFNDNLVANLTNLGGTLASTFGSAASGDITIVVQSGASVFSLFGTNGSVLAHVSSGEIIAATPEASTLALFGAGLLSMGILLWRRKGVQTQQTVAI